MLFTVKDIQFDFDADDVTPEEMIDITDDTLGTWEADDEDDLIDEISTQTGWCIRSIDYVVQLSQWHTGGCGCPLIMYCIEVNQTTPNMRKIERQMCAAIQGNKNWQSGNTAVTFDPESGISTVFLHGNKIAEVSDNDMTIFDGGWQSNTTKSRLNALCAEFCIAGEGVFQKNFQWFIRKFVGETSITGKVFNVEDFENGFVFA